MSKLPAYSVLLLVLLSKPGKAQESNVWLAPGSALGVTIDRFQLNDDFRSTAATLHVSSLKPNHATPEFAISIFPQALAAQILVTNLDLGGALNLPLPRAMLLVRGGASGLFALGGGGGVAVPGLHYGASLLVQIAGKTGVRIDLLRRVFFSPYERTTSMTLGLGITALPAIR